MKLSVPKIQLSLAISWVVLSCTLLQAQPVSRQQIRTPQPLSFKAPPPPPQDIGEPGKRSEAGSRGCSQDMNKPLTSVSQKRLTALVQTSGNPSTVYNFL